jgi:hypothetical protein
VQLGCRTSKGFEGVEKAALVFAVSSVRAERSEAPKNETINP